MSMNNVDPEALRLAARSLDEYVEEVGNSLNNLFNAADTCRENMQDDELSKEAATSVMKSCQSIAKLIKYAEEQSKKIKQYAIRVENTKGGME